MLNDAKNEEWRREETRPYTIVSRDDNKKIRAIIHGFDDFSGHTHSWSR